MSSISSENIPTPFKKPKIFKISEQPKNINQELINTIHNLNEENSQLKEALADLENDLKEKDESIEECQNIINKLKKEYTKVVKEFELMEKSYNELLEEFNQKTFEISENKKTKSVLKLINNTTENNKYLYKQNMFMRKKILSSEDVSLKNENENSNLIDGNDIIKKLQKKNMNYVKIIKEKDLIIEELNIKISELNNIVIKNKNDFDNKIKTSSNILENIFKKENANFSYDDLIKDTFIFSNYKEKIPQEFIITNNLNKELIKSELYSTLIRESHFINFLQKILEKINSSKIKDIFNNIIENKNKYLKLIQENYLLKRTNTLLYKNLLELKEKIKINNSEVKNKCQNLVENISEKFLNLCKVNENDMEIKNNNKSCVIDEQKNFNINYNNIDIINKKIETLKSGKNKNTFPSFENLDKSNRLSQDLPNAHKKQIIKTVRINKMMNKKKKRIRLDKDESDINFKNNSMEFNTFKTEGNNPQDELYPTNESFINKTQIQNNNNDFKNNIFRYQNEFNNPISKSVTQDNKNDSIDEVQKSSFKYTKLSSNIFKKNSDKINLNEIAKKRNDNLKYLRTENDKIRNYKNIIFTPDFFLDLPFKINEGIFAENELNKYMKVYNLTSNENIYMTFKKTCNELKIMTDEIYLKINKSHCLTGTYFSNKTKIKPEPNSFKAFNEKILNLKKLESEYMNMNEYIKNYLISQESTIQLMKKKGKKNIKFEPMDKLFNLLEDCLSYRISEMNENIRFIRKLLIKLFKNQINCLFLSFEYKFK